MIVKVKLRKNGDGGYAMVGAKRRVRVAVTTKDRKTKVLATFKTKKDGTITVSGGKRLEKATAAGAKIRYRVPSRYIHLAERASRFMRNTQAAKMGEAEQKTRAKLAQSITEEIAKR